MAIYFCSGSYMDLSRNRIIFVTSTSCVFLLEQSSYLFCCTPLLPLTLGGAPPLHPLCTPFAPPLHPYHRCCTPRLWRCTPLAPPRTLTGVGLWNITDVLEFPSTLMEQRTLDARGVLYGNTHCLCVKLHTMAKTGNLTPKNGHLIPT